MWQFINPDIIEYIFKFKMSTKDDINDDNFTEEYKNTICFKGTPEEGHYVFVGKDLKAYGTYESDLLFRPEDDGVCHGAAIAYALYFLSQNHNFKFFEKPAKDDLDSFRYNYKKILQVYIILIESGNWDDALAKFFYNDVIWKKGTNGKYTTKQTETAHRILTEYIKRFD